MATDSGRSLEAACAVTHWTLKFSKSHFEFWCMSRLVAIQRVRAPLVRQDLMSHYGTVKVSDLQTECAAILKQFANGKFVAWNAFEVKAEGGCRSRCSCLA